MSKKSHPSDGIDTDGSKGGRFGEVSFPGGFLFVHLFRALNELRASLRMVS
jgi:hypothetical protein